MCALSLTRSRTSHVYVYVLRVLVSFYPSRTELTKIIWHAINVKIAAAATKSDDDDDGDDDKDSNARATLTNAQ